MRYSIYDLTRWGILTALALALSVSESFFFPSALFPVPGMRIGLANIVTLLSIYMFGALPTVLIVVIRCLVTFAFGGNLMSFLFSLAGGMLALFMMLLLRNLRAFSLFGVSVGGAAAHNIGQILIACAIVHSWGVLSYLPVLLLISVVTGVLIAALSAPVYKAVSAIRTGGPS